MSDLGMKVLYKAYGTVLDFQKWINFEHNGMLYELRLMEPIEEDPLEPLWYGKISRLTESLHSKSNTRVDKDYKGGHEVQIYREVYDVHGLSGDGWWAICTLIEDPTCERIVEHHMNKMEKDNAKLPVLDTAVIDDYFRQMGWTDD